MSAPGRFQPDSTIAVSVRFEDGSLKGPLPANIVAAVFVGSGDSEESFSHPVAVKKRIIIINKDHFTLAMLNIQFFI